MTEDIDGLLAAARVTAFVDILGWSSITSAAVNDILRKAALAKETRTPPTFSAEERERLSQYADQLAIARGIDEAVQDILATMRAWMVPATVAGRSASRQTRNFWENLHATFVRVSDCVFILSTSYSTVTYVVSELLKRGLEAGVLMRAGLSVGYVQHVDHPCPPSLDPRSHDISLYGTGITTAVKAEGAAKKTGVRALVHPQLVEILRADVDGGHELVESCCGDPPTEIVEFPWWRDQWRPGMSDQDRDRLTAWSREDIESVINDLESSERFAWNRDSPMGKLGVDDTLQVLRTALAELSATQ